MPSLPIEVVRKAIDSAGYSWAARESDISRLAKNLKAGSLFGLSISEQDRQEIMVESVRKSTSFAAIVLTPPKIDWRDNSGNYVTPIKSQMTCGACVAFATCAVLESRKLIADGTPDVDFDLSEAHLFSCGGGRCTAGWDFELALRQARSPGVGLESDFPYTGRDVACRHIPPVVTVTNWDTLNVMNARKQAIASSGPVIAGMRVYSDFLSYGSGIYKHVIGAFEGLHAVAVVGYDDHDSCWIVKNSWGADWGEHGFVRLAYGECGIDSEFPYFGPTVVAAAPAMA